MKIFGESSMIIVEYDVKSPYLSLTSISAIMII